MTYGRSFGRPGFLGPEPLRLTTTRLGRPDGEPTPAPTGLARNPFEPCSYHVVPVGAWSAQFRCPLCGGPREEVIGRIA